MNRKRVSLISGAVTLGVVAVILLIPEIRPSKPHTYAPTDPSGHLHPICDDALNFICRRKEFDDPTGKVYPDEYGEKASLNLKNTLAKHYPELKEEDLDDLWVEQVFTLERSDRLKRAFRRAVRVIIHRIEDSPSDLYSDSDKELLIKRLKSVKLDIPPPASLYNDEKELMFKNQIYYQSKGPLDLRLRVGGGFVLSSDSWFNLTFSFGHEVAHAIDPCEIAQVAPHQIPRIYSAFTECLTHNHMLSPEDLRKGCTAGSDQLGEHFADTWAVEVALDVLKAYSDEFPGKSFLAAVANSVRDLCESDINATSHPELTLRIDEIFLNHPEMRKVLGCPDRSTTHRYCGLFLSKTKKL